MIWEALNPKLVYLDMEAKTYTDVFEQLGGAVVREGYAKDSYVQALSEREAEFPTGLDIDGFGVAIPHTAVEHVNKSGIAIARLKEPVTFIQMGSDDDPVEVKLVFMLAVIDPKQHIEELQRILGIITDKSVLIKLAGDDVTDEQEIIDIIKEKESEL